MASFKNAFAKAKEGSTFEWNGKSYKKEYAKGDGKSAAPKPAAKSAPKPSKSEPSPSPKPGFTSAGKGVMRNRPAGASTDSPKRGFGDTVGTFVGKAAKAVTGSDAAQVLAGSLAGRRRAFTEEDFSPETLDQVRSAARQLRSDAKSGKTQIDRDNRGKLKRNFGQLDYAHYGRENNVNLSSTDQKNAAANSFGRARIDYDAKGNPTSLTDAYGFNNKNRRAQLDRYKRIADTAEGATRLTPLAPVARGIAKAGTVAYDFGSDLLNQGKPARSNPKRKATWKDTKENLVANIGTAIMGDEEVPVKIDLKEKKKAGGGAVKAYAKGGMVRGDGCATKGKTKGRFI